MDQIDSIDIRIREGTAEAAAVSLELIAAALRSGDFDAVNERILANSLYVAYTVTYRDQEVELAEFTSPVASGANT
jgi:hypothetical protein